jgi:hypothetical protein
LILRRFWRVNNASGVFITIEMIATAVAALHEISGSNWLSDV